MDERARVQATQLVDLNATRVLAGTRGTLQGYAQDGRTVRVVWDWACVMPPERGEFVPRDDVELAEVPAGAVVAI